MRELEKELYLGYIKEAGFKNITIKNEGCKLFPDEKLKKKLPDREIITICIRASRKMQGITESAEQKAFRSKSKNSTRKIKHSKL